MGNKYTRNRGGLLVITKSGKTGRTYHSDPLINGKKPVYILKDSQRTGEKLLCDPKTLEIKGFID